MHKKYINREYLHLCAAIAICFSKNARPSYTYEIEQITILHWDEVIFYIQTFIQMISGKLVMKEFLTDMKIVVKIAIGAVVEESEDTIPCKATDLKVIEGNPQIEKIVYENECSKSQFKEGTASELKAVFPNIEERVAFVIMKAYEQK